YTTENRKTTHETLNRLLREYPKLVWCPRAASTNGQYKELACRLSSGSDCLRKTLQCVRRALKRLEGGRFSILLIAVCADMRTSSLMITVENHEAKHTYRTHYIAVDLLLNAQDANIYYGLDLQALNKLHHLIRDLQIDVQKGLALYGSKRSSIRAKRTDLGILVVSFWVWVWYCYLSIFSYSQRSHFSVSFSVIPFSMFQAVNRVEAK
uniref:D-glucuronyl C5-epimerase beta-sandwich domain-containing protein n=1 Tax=Glossina palpalis gambiensis TaxID=67801 RepID=A0A1B0AKM4_9MUSC